MRNLTQRLSLAAAVASLIAALWTFAPPLRVSAQFANQSLLAYSVGGTANAVTMSVHNMFVLTKNVPFSFVPASSNTGPATINVNNIGNVNVKRPSSLGLVGLSGGEFHAGVLTTVVYDGTNINLVYPVDMTPIGSTIALRTPTAPPGYLIEDGSCVSQTTYAPLFAAIGATYGAGCGGGLFALPDSRGTSLFALDDQGANGSANRLTSAGSGCTATSLTPTICGSQNQTLLASQIPTINFSGTTSNSVPTGGQGGVIVNQSGSGVAYTGVFSIGVTGSSTNTGGQPHPIVPPASLIVRAIKY